MGLVNGRVRTGSMHRRAAVGGVAALALVAGLPVAAGATAARALPPSLVRAVHWARCGHSIPKPFQCATAPVPLSYANPGGAQIRLSLIRLPAADPGKRIGSLFVDFGGPGGPDVTDLVNRAYTVFSAAIRAV